MSLVLETVALRLVMRQVVFLVTVGIRHVVPTENSTTDLVAKLVMVLV